MKSILERNRFRITHKFTRFYNSTENNEHRKNNNSIVKSDNSIINYKMVLGIKKIEISNLSSLCRDFHNIFRINKYALVKYTNDVLPFIKYLRTSEIVMILHHYAHINYNNINFYNNVWNQIINKLYDIDCKELALIIYSMGKIKYLNNKDMILLFESEIKKWINKLSGRDCSLILKGLNNLNYNNNNIYLMIYDRILTIADDLNLLDICIILNTHSKSKNININIFEILLNKSLSFYSFLNEQCIASLLWSVSNASIKSEKYFSLLTLKLRLLMHEKLIKNSEISQEKIPDSNAQNVDIKKDATRDKAPINDPDSGKVLERPNNDKILERQKQNVERPQRNVEQPQQSVERNNQGKITNDNDNFFENYNDVISESQPYDSEDKQDDDNLKSLNYEISMNSSCKYENLIPSIIYSFGKQRTYLKNNINIDKKLYNHIINSYNAQNYINKSPVDTVYIFDISRDFLRDKNVFNNSNINDKNKIKLKKYQNKKYYEHIIFIINNYLTHFINNVHYNDLKNILFGIAKIEMFIDKKLFNNIFELIIFHVKKNMYKSYEIINLSRSLSLLPHVPTNIWIDIFEFYKNKFISNTSVKNNCYLFYIFSFVKKKLNNYNFDICLIEHINKKIVNINEDDVINVIKALINLNYYNNELVNNISNYIEKNYTAFNLIDIVYILKYFTSMDLRNTNIFSLFALTVKKNNTKHNYAIISTISSFYLQMNIFPKTIEDILLQEKKSSEICFKTEEIICDE
ncbi:heptatricopeptide repeat-containing protein, putative [Plasmodium yoelii]|uniref:Heptatricopeptide repeat-containing protein, putative n=1 Tax=Plasmodium yoelii TaxID=5861 RepID=A0A078K740_PLAYE|nr:heptatricopeptide repeat-containing protein, putative [Plasmodium yoelii]CDU19281.1 conserved Plasmodium protein, unknown function [Plasmodium yoelii]VTZ79916.1 heptatricopeptide repeat-containing protein, putative [Plasmodium yoelii]|eukprot:XP_022812587.1 heptatricopeptide repeat-containing protein, putative [Plasmodium yoelii]